MLHGAGIFTYIWVIFWANVGKYSSTMEHMDIEYTCTYTSILNNEPQFKMADGILILSSISVDEESLVSTSGVSKRLGEAGLLAEP